MNIVKLMSHRMAEGSGEGIDEVKVAGREAWSSSAMNYQQRLHRVVAHRLTGR
jgi:hypothetical protein